MFNVGDRVRYTGKHNIRNINWIGRTGVIDGHSPALLAVGKTRIVWDIPESLWPEDATAWAYLDNLELVEDEPVTEPDRDWIVLLMGPGGRKPVPFGPYTLDELFNVLEKGLVKTGDDEYLVKAQLRTDVR